MSFFTTITLKINQFWNKRLIPFTHKPWYFMVLFLFVIMFLNLNKEVERNKSILYWLGAIVSAGCIFLMLVSSVGKVALTNGNIEKENYTLGLVENIGMSLYTDYLFPMEICSVLFLVAMIGVVLLSRKENKFTTNTVSNV